ncbi:hypothetical protein AMELA_G00141810 [Ameiurus melas]|uniref:Uncharacterized protein n=1 Tax=Ameiurus melas TaxID=219545 RepID=A0A7J6AKT7_AMEME|nr:hypothetical protein AMELA_G00141810 [Ameiurus melas]
MIICKTIKQTAMEKFVIFISQTSTTQQNIQLRCMPKMVMGTEQLSLIWIISLNTMTKPLLDSWSFSLFSHLLHCRLSSTKSIFQREGSQAAADDIDDPRSGDEGQCQVKILWVSVLLISGGGWMLASFKKYSCYVGLLKHCNFSCL